METENSMSSKRALEVGDVVYLFYGSDPSYPNQTNWSACAVVTTVSEEHAWSGSWCFYRAVSAEGEVSLLTDSDNARLVIETPALKELRERRELLRYLREFDFDSMATSDLRIIKNLITPSGFFILEL